MADKVKEIKTFVIRKTYEFRVEEYSREDAVIKAAEMVPSDDEKLISTKVGTLAQMKIKA